MIEKQFFIVRGRKKNSLFKRVSERNKTLPEKKTLPKVVEKKNKPIMIFLFIINRATQKN